MTRPFNIRECERWIVIHRCIHFRGAQQEAALDELARRGLWLSPKQVKAAEVSRERAGLGPEVTS